MVNFESHCLIESFPSSEELPKVLDLKGGLHSSDVASQLLFLCHALFMLWVCVASLQVVGRKRRMQMKYGLSPLSVWLSPTLLALLLFNVVPLPLSQSAAGLTSGC